jgi:hypothetical protein
MDEQQRADRSTQTSEIAALPTDFAAWAASAGGVDSESYIALFLMHRYGPMLTRDQLVSVLGFPTSEALERAVQRGSLKLKVVRIPNRRGMYALAPDVAKYLVEISRTEVDPGTEREKER